MKQFLTIFRPVWSRLPSTSVFSISATQRRKLSSSMPTRSGVMCFSRNGM